MDLLKLRISHGRCRIDQIANLERGGKCWAKLDQFSPMVFLIRYEM